MSKQFSYSKAQKKKTLPRIYSSLDVKRQIYLADVREITVEVVIQPPVVTICHKPISTHPYITH